MNRNEFIYRLTKALELQVPVQDIYDARLYYTSLFDEAGLDGEQQLLSQLALPQEIARDIIDQNNERTQKRRNKVHQEAKDWEFWRLRRHSLHRGLQLVKDNLALSRLEHSRARTILLWLGLALCAVILCALGVGIVWHTVQLYQSMVLARTYQFTAIVLPATQYLYIGNIMLFVLMGMMLLRHGFYGVSALALRMARIAKENKA